MSKNADPNYEVGYAKPPKQTQFKKGQSGNPKGRPPGFIGPPATPSDAYVRVLSKPIRVQLDGKTRNISMLEALIRKQVQIALKEDGKYSYLALRDVLTRGFDWEKEAGEISVEKLQFIIDTKIKQLQTELGIEPGVELESEPKQKV